MQTYLRNLIFFVSVIALALVLIYVPQSLSPLIFAILIIGAFSVALWHTLRDRVKFRQQLRAFLAQARWLWEKTRHPIAIALDGVAIFCVCASTYTFSNATGSEGLQTAVMWMVLGGIVFIGALSFSKLTYGLPRPSDMSLSGRPCWGLIGLGAIPLFILAEINGQNFHLLERVPSHIQAILLISGLLLIVLGSGMERPRLSFRHEMLPLLAITLLGLILRLYHLNTSIRLFVDEILFSSGVERFWFDHDIPVLHWITENAPYPQLFTYLQAWGVELFGRNLFGLRVVSAIMGALTIPALYGLARTLFDRPTALLSALLLATFPPHVHFSRIGLNNIADPLFGTLALMFWGRGVLYNRGSDYILGGLFLGLTQYFYEGARLLFPPLIAIWIIGGWLVWKPRANVKGVLLAAFVALLVGMPIYYTLISTDAPLTAHLDASGSSRDYGDRFSDPQRRDEYLKQYLQRSFQFYVQLRDESLYYVGETPLLLNFVIPFFMLGIFVALKEWRTPRNILVLWILATTFGNSLLQNSVFSSRYVGVMPLLMLFVALGIRYSLPLFTGRYQFAAMSILVGLIALGQVDYYYNEHLPTFNRQVRFRADAADAVFRSVDFPPHTQVYIVGEPNRDYHRAMLNFLADDIILNTVALEGFTPSFLNTLPRDVDYAFFLLPGDEIHLGLLQRAFTLEPPSYTTNPDVPPDKAYVLYFAPRQTD